MDETPDRIEKRVTLNAPIARVWRAISDSKEFGSWFGMELDEPFVAGRTVTGRIKPTSVDAEVATSQEPYRGVAVQLDIERVEAMRLFSFRWRPGAVDPAIDYSREPTTLVTFALEQSGGATLLTLTESGFHGLPLERRAKTFAGNDGGWTAQMTLIAKYLATHAQG